MKLLLVVEVIRGALRGGPKRSHFWNIPKRSNEGVRCHLVPF